MSYTKGLSRSERRHLDRAIAIASTSSQRQKHGCVIAVGKRTLAVGINRARNPPGVCTDPQREASVHAEIAAIKALNRGMDWSKVTVYSARLLKSGEPAMAAPCSRCKSVLDFLGVGRVIHT